MTQICAFTTHSPTGTHMDDSLTKSPSNLRELVRSGTEGTRSELGKDVSNELRGIRYFARATNRRDESAPKVALATDRGREE